ETKVEDVMEMMRYLTHEVGIDGMLVAPGYQYSQIDPELTMTRAEHQEKFKRIRAIAHEHGYRWLATPLYQDFLTGEKKLACAACRTGRSSRSASPAHSTTGSPAATCSTRCASSTSAGRRSGKARRSAPRERGPGRSSRQTVWWTTRPSGCACTSGRARTRST